MFNPYTLVMLPMALCFVISICTIILNHKASIYFWDKLQSNPYLDVSVLRKMRQSTVKQFILLYCVYITCSMCICLFFLCHISKAFPSWFCEYGLASDMILYFAAKTFFYGYLLERAQLIQSEDHPLLPSCVLSKLFPIYLFLYSMTWLIVSALSFRGTLLESESGSGSLECVFDAYASHVPLFVIQSVCDLLHCIGLTLLFLVPNCRDILHSRSEVFNTPQQVHIFVSQSNIHLLCVGLCWLSSLAFMISTGTKYLWLSATLDMCCNVVAAFFTLTSNRAYLSHFTCSSYCNCSKWMQCKVCCHSVTQFLIYKMENPPKKDTTDDTDSDEHEQHEELDGDDVPGMQNDQSIPMFLNNNSLLTQPEIEDFDLPLMSINDSLQTQTDEPSGMFNLIFLPVH
eukprot:338850_1